MRYDADLEPWEYQDSDYMLVCLACHERIHGR